MSIIVVMIVFGGGGVHITFSDPASDTLLAAGTELFKDANYCLVHLRSECKMFIQILVEHWLYCITLDIRHYPGSSE